MTRPAEKVKVVRAPENTIDSALYHTGDGYDWVFESTEYTKLDVVCPGFFNIHRGRGLHVGAIIECRLGSIEDGITQVWLQVIKAPVQERRDADDVLVSVGSSRKFTPVRHSGAMAEEKAA